MMRDRPTREPSAADLLATSIVALLAIPAVVAAAAAVVILLLAFR